MIEVVKGHECYHCKQWIPEGVEHDCWTTTEAALTKGLSEDLREAWERIRETAVEFGEQRIYASHSSIMFSRKACHFFVRPGQKRLELVIFLGRPIKAAIVKKVVRTSKTKVAHLIHIVHRDQVEAPITDWMREAYGLQDAVAAKRPAGSGRKKARRPARSRKSAGARARAKRPRGR